MTREEIEKLEAGREMDELIGEKVMGWLRNPGPTHLLPTQGFFKDVDGFSEWLAIENWKPSSDISAAWEVLEKMESNDYWWEMSNVVPNSDPIVYELRFEKLGKSYYACEFSVPMAICKAALLSTI